MALPGSVDGLSVIVTADTTIVYAWVPVLVFASVAVTVKFDDPGDVGVPDITPVDDTNARPVGSIPEVTVNTYGLVPPDAVIVCV
jgi:hypothetical protein